MTDHFQYCTCRQCFIVWAITYPDGAPFGYEDWRESRREEQIAFVSREDDE